MMFVANIANSFVFAKYCRSSHSALDGMPQIRRRSGLECVQATCPDLCVARVNNSRLVQGEVTISQTKYLPDANNTIPELI